MHLPGRWASYPKIVLPGKRFIYLVGILTTGYPRVLFEYLVHVLARSALADNPCIRDRVKCLFGNFYFSTFISPFDQSVSVSQFVLQVSKPILAITRLSYETGYIIVADTHVPFWYGSGTNTSSLYECVRSVYMYEICLCLSACVLLRVLLVHMDATHCT